MEKVDWATLQIVETHDDEGRIELMSESQMCEILGLSDEGTTNNEQGNDNEHDNEQGNDNELGHDIDGAAIPTSDAVPGEMVISYDKNNPSMEVGTMYPTMEEFKLAVRQFAIKKEFHLGVEKSCKTIYRAFCKSGDEGRPCTWRINARKMKGSATVEVNNFFIISFLFVLFHSCLYENDWCHAFLIMVEYIAYSTIGASIQLACMQYYICIYALCMHAVRICFPIPAWLCISFIHFDVTLPCEATSMYMHICIMHALYVDTWIG
jgi:hypothetical protein